MPKCSLVFLLYFVVITMNIIYASMQFFISVSIIPKFTFTLLMIPRKAPSSPCPDIFSYQRMVGEDDEMPWKGVIRVTPPATEHILLLKVKFKLRTILPTKYVGKIKLKEKKDKLINKMVSGNQSEVIYDVMFPLVSPLPRLEKIQLNGRIICSDASESGPLITSINLEHSIFPLLNYEYVHSELDEREYGNTSNKCNNYEQSECGQSIVRQALIYDGKEPLRGVWPWVVPIYVKIERGIQFHCAGSLVSQWHVITAGHCFENRGQKPLPSSAFIAFVGKFDLQDWEEDGVQVRLVERVDVHEEYNAVNLQNDIAILKLRKPITFSVYARPACLWVEGVKEDLSGESGTLIGWGKDGEEHNITRKPNAINIPIASREQCRDNHSLFAKTDKILCAGAKDGSGPCKGDSGNGLFILVNRRWTLTAVVSFALTDKQPCDLDNYVGYTDVTKYENWIKNRMKNV